MNSYIEEDYFDMLARENRITTKSQLKDWLSYEKSKYGVGGIKYFLKIDEGSVLYSHQVLLRKAEFCSNTGKKLLYSYYRLRLIKMQNKYALHIPLNCCGRGLKIMHLGPVLINDNVTVGEDCSIHMNVSIVAGGTSNDVPVLGNHIVIGVGAAILGGVHIADNVAVGANAVVNKDILEENIAVAGVPAKKISNNGALKWNKKPE